VRPPIGDNVACVCRERLRADSLHVVSSPVRLLRSENIEQRSRLSDVSSSASFGNVVPTTQSHDSIVSKCLRIAIWLLIDYAGNWPELIFANQIRGTNNLN